MKRLLLSTALVLGFAQSASAAIPVVDWSSIAQQIRQLDQMLEDFGLQSDLLDTALEQLRTLEEQYTKLTQTYEALTGERDIMELVMGGELDNLLGGNFTDVVGSIQAVQQGDWSQLTGPNAGRMREGIEGVLNEAGFDAATLERLAAGNPSGDGPSDPGGTPGDGVGTDEEAQRIATRATTGATLSAAAQVSHENAGVEAERLEALVAAIGEQPDLKASIDHNTRVTAEIGIVLLEMLRLQSIATVGAGQAGVIDAATIAAEREYTDFTLPDLE
ncbi:type IV secretion system protein [Rubellimicrobium aerolatum]|uniref:Type IV secretion system protein n=1 Tax=Rubellimicrobium aerolatum TaxID=490979 RepID=A0ABW0SE89_9RHOB|nr:type IV secretion system protein [Rubellimicrobium aerolatum]MBP1806985.1 type IV secretion system protein VirB5 [Rubellimicrobium aerolatum]